MPPEDAHSEPVPTPTPEAAPGREPVLLTPFRLPAQSALYLGNEDVACFLNGYLALWHPAVLLRASTLPRTESPYDHEQPAGSHLYALPENPPLMLPDEWEERAKSAGEVYFRATPERPSTLANLREALFAHSTREGAAPDAEVLALLDLPADRVAPFFGIGFGCAQLAALCEAMSHDLVLDTVALIQDLQEAARALLAESGAEAATQALKAAADKLMAAREVLYPVTIHLIDLALLTRNNLDQPLPVALDHGSPLTVVAPSLQLGAWADAHPEERELLRRAVAEGKAEVAGGNAVEREDVLLPLESQLWNLEAGQEMAREVTGAPVKVHGRQRFGAGPLTPSLLQAAGLTRTLLVAFDEASLPAHRSPTVSWPAVDGKQVDAFCRAPHAADNPQTFFHIAHHLHETIMQDQTATLVLAHTKPACPWYDDWLALSGLAPVLGTWTTLSRYFDDTSLGDYTQPAPADEFHADHLSERTGDAEASAATYGYSSGGSSKLLTVGATEESRRHPVSAFAAHARSRRKLDAAWTFAAIYRSLAGKTEDLSLETALARLEDQIEASAPASLRGTPVGEELEAMLQKSAGRLAERLLARADKEEPGYLLLNPCSFARRVVLELEGLTATVPVQGPVKASQLDGTTARLVAEVPALGFAWIPKGGPGPAPASRMRLADERTVRNEFFEATIDPATGGLRSIADARTRMPRLGQQLVYNPGSQVKLKQIKTTSTGPGYGEVVSEGALVDEHEEVLATFRQRFRAWMGRPVLDLRIEIFPQKRPEGYPWHSYFGARFAWRDERATLLRGVNGLGYVTSQTRPEAPDYLDVRLGRQSTVLLTGGLPFHQRQGGRMVDVILVAPGEEAQAFDLAIGLDRDYPMLTAVGMVSPVVAVPSSKGPPHVGATGWLYHLDVPNLLLTSLRPAPGGADGVVARVVECGSHAGHAEFRCVRDPASVQRINLRGEVIDGISYHGDTVFLDTAEGELVQLRIDFTTETPPEPPDESAAGGYDYDRPPD